MSLNIEKIIQNHLPQVIHMSLATSASNKPWISEVHFIFTFWTFWILFHPNIIRFT